MEKSGMRLQSVMFNDNKRLRSSAKGFTLLEVALGVTILAVLAGTMFTIIQTSLQATNDIQVVQRENRRLERYVFLLQQLFKTLPPEARVGLRIVEREPLTQELTLTGAPEMFVWGDEPITGESVTLSLRRYPEALVTETSPEFFIGLSRPDFFRPDSADGIQQELSSGALDYPVGRRNLPIIADDQGRYWLPIIPGVRSMTWRFYQLDKKRWIEESGPIRPPLIELTIMPFERNIPIRSVFAIK